MTTTEPTLIARRDDLVQRAAALVPVLRERAAEAEQLRRLPDATIADFRAGGLYRVANPERYGGIGLDVDAYWEATFEVGRGCGSSAWIYAVLASHNWLIGHFPEAAQDEYFADGPDVLSSSAFNPSGARLTPAPGGFRLSGRWDFSSGCDHGSWAMLGALAPDGLYWVLVPRADYMIADTWFVSGLRGTGSKDIVIADAFVPAHRAVDFRRLREGATEGYRLHGRPSYRAWLMMLFPLNLASPLVGMAQGAIETFAAQLRERHTPAGGTLADLPANQLRLAESSAETDLARLLVRATYADVLAQAARGEAPSLLDRARYQRDHGFIAQLCVRAVNRLFDAGGGHALYDDNPLQRFHRDIHAGSHQMALRWDTLAEQYGRVALGLDVPADGRI